MKMIDRYLEWMRVRLPDLSGLNFGIDVSNGMASLLAHRLFPDAKIINENMDGTFPAHSPNPLKAEAREQISAMVKSEHLDVGVIFDGDADRAMFVDEKGEFVQPDYLIPIVAQATGKGKITHDVRTSRGAIEALLRMDCEPLMVPVGHAFAKPILRSSGAICGGELAGHYYFREFYCCDSGILAAMRILGEVAKAKRQGRTFSELMAPIREVYENSGEMNFKVEDKDAAILRVLSRSKEQMPREISRNTMDGIRIEYEDGWINIRKSNTEPYLRMIVERKGDVNEWVELLEQAINEG